MSKMKELLLIQVSLTLVVHVFGALHKGCPSSKWTHYGKNCYIIPDGPFLTWADGRKLCQSLGGDFVLPRSQQENDFIYQMVLFNQSASEHNIWARCYFDNGQWDCAKDPDEYTNWSTTFEKLGPCTIMLHFDRGKWHGIPCDDIYLRRVMCQRSQRSVSISALTCSAIPHGQPRCLADHTLTEFRVRIPVQCCIACSRDPTCRSFNMKGDMCQLNNVTASEVNGDYFNIVPDCVYYEYE